MTDDPPYVIGVTGASGATVAKRVLQGLRSARSPVALVVSQGGETVIREELGETVDTFHSLVRDVYANDDLTAPIASGSRRSRGMAIVPCSGNTVAHVAAGLADTLITRAAQVHLKERRPLVLVPRETPMSTLLLRQLASLSELGSVILPASPAFYLKPADADSMADYLAGKVLDHLEVPHSLYRGWKEGAS